MGNIKQINIKNCTYYFFNDMINITDFDSSLLEIDKKSYMTIQNSMIIKIFVVQIPCTSLLIKEVATLKKVMEINT